jgi:hypothetical protein
MTSTISSKLSECSCSEATTSGGMSCRRGNAERNAEVRTPCLACHAASSVASRNPTARVASSLVLRLPPAGLPGRGSKHARGRQKRERSRTSHLGWLFSVSRVWLCDAVSALERFGVAMSSGNAYSVLRQVLLWFGAREIDSGLGWSLWIDRERFAGRPLGEGSESHDEGSFWHESFGDRCDRGRCAPS